MLKSCGASPDVDVELDMSMQNWEIIVNGHSGNWQLCAAFVILCSAEIVMSSNHELKIILHHSSSLPRSWVS
jgi:hypothetical protein